MPVRAAEAFVSLEVLPRWCQDPRRLRARLADEGFVYNAAEGSLLPPLKACQADEGLFYNADEGLLIRL